MESAHKIQTIVFDKTGTITEGKPVVTDILAYNGYDDEAVLTIAASGEMGSEHPLGEAIVERSKEKGYTLKSTLILKQFRVMGLK